MLTIVRFLDHISGAGCIIHCQFYKKCSPACAVKIFSRRNQPVGVQWHLLKQVAVQTDLWGTQGVSPPVLTQALSGSGTFASLCLLRAREGCSVLRVWLQAPEGSESDWEYRMFLVPETEHWDVSYIPWADWQCLQLISSSSSSSSSCMGWVMPGFALWDWLSHKTDCAVRNKKWA